LLSQGYKFYDYATATLAKKKEKEAEQRLMQDENDQNQPIKLLSAKSPKQIDR